MVSPWRQQTSTFCIIAWKPISLLVARLSVICLTVLVGRGVARLVQPRAGAANAHDSFKEAPTPSTAITENGRDLALDPEETLLELEIRHTIDRHHEFGLFSEHGQPLLILAENLKGLLCLWTNTTYFDGQVITSEQ
jgi:hypothetical protein